MIIESVTAPAEVVEASEPVTLTPLAAALDEAEAKRAADVIRFRTCCADARASK
jgi:hypothetical protein